MSLEKFKGVFIAFYSVYDDEVMLVLRERKN